MTQRWVSLAAGSGWRAAGFEWGVIPFVRCRGAFADASLQRLRAAILSSPYLSDNNLNYRFSGTRGFSVVFHAEARGRVAATFPEMAEYLEATLEPRCNAFFLNPLVMFESARVAPHLDRSLRSFTSPDEPPNPFKVSVLYVRIPPGLRGGSLVLYHRLLPLARVAPRENDLVEFQGFLRHEVTAIAAGAEARVSLVCEQYVLDERLLRRVPAFTVRSTSGFDAFYAAELQHAKAIPRMVMAERVTDEQRAAAREGNADPRPNPAEPFPEDP